MNKLEEYIVRYQGIHDGTDPFLVGTRLEKNNTIVGKGKILFDGSQLGRKLTPFIEQLIVKKQRAITLLDYGCGKAVHVFQPLSEHNNKTLLGRLNGMIQSYYCYDPAVKNYSTKPTPGTLFDLICCADVMEHIPEEFVESVLLEIKSFSKDDSTVMFTISGNLAKKSFSDGENLHATVRPVEWWLNYLITIFNDRAFLLFYNDETKPDEPIVLCYHNSQHCNFWKFPTEGVKAGGHPCQAKEV